ncbi:homoserine kinase [Clostridium sp. B9]|uniref:homoserine kinase n=1 Tax=Clostridium sp. B9 TaxID=3423224 RepID=UPI003D2F478F
MIKVRVPATTANMGAGFDCLGIALGVYNTFTIEEIEEGLIIEGCRKKYRNKDNMIYCALQECFEKLGYKGKGIRIKVEGEIPESRGLGSSASCILGGIIGGNELLGGQLSKHEILELATIIEGHPDNIAPALFGGMTVAIQEGNSVYHNEIDIKDDLKFCALIPNFTLSTEESRSVLPKKIDYKDGVFNTGRVALMLSAFANGRFDLVKHGCQDRLHQQYRGKLIENYDEIIRVCSKQSIGTFLSGAGPTIMNVISKEDNKFNEIMKEFVEPMNGVWQVKEFDVDFKGATVEL